MTTCALPGGGHSELPVVHSLVPRFDVTHYPDTTLLWKLEVDVAGVQFDSSLFVLRRVVALHVLVVALQMTKAFVSSPNAAQLR